MCVDAKTSLSFFVVGTIINIFIFKKTTNVEYLMLIGIYQFILLMQFFDFLCWTDLKCGIQNKMATIVAFIQNMLQPVVIILILLNFTQSKKKSNKLIVSLLLCIYISIIIYNFYFKKYEPITCLKPTEKCKHLQYDWWSVIGDYSLVVYLVPIVFSFFLLLKNMKFALIHSVYLILSGIISNIFYSCGIPSIFCLFAMGGPLLNYILMKNKI
jgi:hypothetical protein